MRVKATRLGILVVLSMFLAPRAFADLMVHHKPDDYKPGKSERYAIWFDDGKWHVRTTTSEHLHHFKGKIQCKGGKIEDVDGDDVEHHGKQEDHFMRHDNDHELMFDFATKEDEDGLNFKVSKDCASLTWDLEIGPGDEHAKTKKEKSNVYVGKDGQHPHSIPFTTKAHP